MLECDSCHAEMYGPADDFRCRGCDLYVCQLCTDVFEHLEDGLHEKGDPMEAVRNLRTQLAATQEIVRDYEKVVEMGAERAVNRETQLTAQQQRAERAEAIALIVLDAWSSLPVGRYFMDAVQDWLVNKMAPAIQRIRDMETTTETDSADGAE